MSVWAWLLQVDGPNANQLDIMFRARNPAQVGDRTAWHNGLSDGTSSIGTGDIYLGGTSEERNDTAKHEWGHAWHYNRTHPNHLNGSNFFKRALSESIADTIVAFQEDDWVMNLVTGGSRNLNNATTWSNWGQAPLYSTYHNSSVIISDLFYDIQFAIGRDAGRSLFFEIADGANGAAYDAISDLRLDLKDYIYNPVYLTPSQRSAVCQIWVQKNMPGTLCAAPAKPASISIINTGQCHYFTPEGGGTAYGSKFSISWSNVAWEDYFEFQVSQNPFSGYVTKLTTARNDTDLYPSYFFTNALFYVGVRACNESGCSALSSGPAQNTCGDPG